MPLQDSRPSRSSSFTRILPLRLPFFYFLFSILYLTTTLAAETPATAPAKTAKRFFWKVTSPTTTIYLLGSIHVASPDMYPLPTEIQAAFKASKNLVVEADITKVDQMALAMQIMQQGSYPQGDSLEKHLSPETWKALQTFCTKNGLPVALLQSLKPAVAATMVEGLVIQQLGLDPNLGIDKHFLDAANESKDKKIIELESADSQLKLILSLDDKLADAWLAQTLSETNKDEFDKVIKAWQTGDDKTLITMMSDDEKDAAGKDLANRLIYSRNDDMLKKIEPLLQSKDPSLVIVGAAHLLGEKGLIQKLKSKNYTVEQPELAPPAK